jgi:hypothetical protein
MFGLEPVWTGTVEWLATGSPPNGLLVLALLTNPAVWSARANALVREAGRAATKRVTREKSGGS